MSELTFQLENKLDFANLETGAEDQTMEIVLKAPSYQNQKQYFRVYQHLSAALVTMSNRMAATQAPRARQAESDDEAMDGEAVVMILSSGCDDFARVIEDFGALALTVGFLNEKTPLKPKHLDAMGPNEVIRMCGEYVAFFVAPSLLSRTKKRGSRR